jgi:5-methylcytosine-specific restriction endonuclease McrA
MARHFSAKVQEQALAIADGKCAECGGQLKPGQFQPHHKIPRWKGGDNSLSNAKILCSACHMAADDDHDFDNMRKADKKGKATEALPVAEGKPEIQRRFK